MSVFRRDNVADYVPKLEELQDETVSGLRLPIPNCVGVLEPRLSARSPVVMAASIRGCLAFPSV